MSELVVEIKTLIIEALDLEDLTPDDIDTDAPLFVDGLGLDSIDALELGVAVKKAYNVTIDGNSENSKKHFYSVKTLSDFIQSNK